MKYMEDWRRIQKFSVNHGLLHYTHFSFSLHTITFCAQYKKTSLIKLHIGKQ